jgi:hypothetical protein
VEIALLTITCRRAGELRATCGRLPLSIAQVPVYDFGGADKPNEKYGVRDFKAKFRGNLVCYGRNTCVHTPLVLHLSKIGCRLYCHWL